jgi:hypothetical protein
MKSTILRGIQQVLGRSGYNTLFIVLSLSFLTLYVALPVFTIPGNSLLTQLSIFSYVDYILFPTLAILSSLVITTQVFIYCRVSNMNGLATSTGGAMSAFVVVLGKAGCVSCLAQLLALFGIGFSGTLFVLEYRVYISVLALLLLSLSLYLNTRNIVKGVCSTETV